MIWMNEGNNVLWTHDVNKIQSGDFCFLLSCGQIISNKLLSRNKHNLVVHESDLPHGKGWSPLSWQILEGKNEIPIVLFEATSSVDSGNIYIKEIMSFNGTELVDELRQVQATHTISMCLKFIRDYPSILSSAHPQSGEATYYRKRTAKDSRIDPKVSIIDQFNLLRIVDNERYPAFFEYLGEKYVLHIEKVKRNEI
ncbi:formyltransferase family protein [Brevibacillus agri]|uniref:formyltransferase family protein n=1 Tax=Brevibacillus agri TaxID=51101 RepID=UPI002E1C061B|nr:formyltransferase family protein [Brevibacillus agri]MED1642043.1 formyltransferase family protein [Brevibacillus agri]MED1655875.1 formyltransferase family protein [Brevibacillus agri]MED1685016.1 formyltransferase family protein [Brevibacillus agri]MED1693611.1 formyltransferase family protein [Brevibacillus agri]MED1697575.1 formyltransferase family protein [Brevibacillus agri]